MGEKVPWKTWMLIRLPVTSQPCIFPQKDAAYLPVTSRPPIWQLAFWSLSPLNFATHDMEDPFATPIWGLSGPVLRDTARLSQRYPSIAHYGVFGVSIWRIGCDTPSPFAVCFPPWRACEVEVRYPPSKGVSQRYLRDTLWKQRKWVRYPPLRYYLERVLRDTL